MGSHPTDALFFRPSFPFASTSRPPYPVCAYAFPFASDGPLPPSQAALSALPFHWAQSSSEGGWRATPHPYGMGERESIPWERREDAGGCPPLVVDMRDTRRRSSGTESAVERTEIDGHAEARVRRKRRRREEEEEERRMRRSPPSSLSFSWDFTPAPLPPFGASRADGAWDTSFFPAFPSSVPPPFSCIPHVSPSEWVSSDETTGATAGAFPPPFARARAAASSSFASYRDDDSEKRSGRPSSGVRRGEGGVHTAMRSNRRTNVQGEFPTWNGDPDGSEDDNEEEEEWHGGRQRRPFLSVPSALPLPPGLSDGLYRSTPSNPFAAFQKRCGGRR